MSGSNWSARIWAEGLVSNILAVVHKQWVVRNAVVHQHDELGLNVWEG